MKYVYLILLCLFLCLCIQSRVRVEFPVYLDKVSQIVEVTKDVLQSQKLYTKKQLQEALDKNPVRIYGLDVSVFKCTSNILCYGEFASKNGMLTITYAAKYKNWDTVLAHEFMHFFKWTIDKTSDASHEDERFFELGCRKKYSFDSDILKVCLKNSAEIIIKEKIKILDDAL